MELNADEQKEWLNNITSHIQNQGLSTPNVEIKHIEVAIKVCILLYSTDFPSLNELFLIF